MKLKNVPNTSGKTCACGTWLDHWKKFSKQTPPTYCPADGCLEKAEVGAHVQKDGDNSTYIVPLCKKHNADTGTFVVPDYTALVSANVSQTCGKARVA
jgi:hypothetical protein